jgi:hypothetical protein
MGVCFVPVSCGVFSVKYLSTKHGARSTCVALGQVHLCGPAEGRNKTNCLLNTRRDESRDLSMRSYVGLDPSGVTPRRPVDVLAITRQSPRLNIHVLYGENVKQSGVTPNQGHARP